MILLLVILLSSFKPPSRWLCFALLLTEIVAVNLLISHFGAATNPYAIVLLVPLVLALTLLPVTLAIVLLVCSIAGQLWQLYPMSAMAHHDMAQHASSMVWGFVLTSLLLATVIGYFRWQLSQSNRAISELREKQLRNEQLLAIGTAAAQLTHDAASPIQTISLLLEEFDETQNPDRLIDAREQVQRLSHALNEWRGVADDIRESRLIRYETAALLKAVRHNLLLARPEALIHWQNHKQSAFITADRTLLPALTNVIINACEGDDGHARHEVSVHTDLTNASWTLRIYNPVSQDQAFDTLGRQIVQSDKGHGLGAVISNATIEKFSGTVTWQHVKLDDTDFLETTIILPCTHE